MERIFSIKAKHHPEFYYYNCYNLEIYIRNKNICEFTVNGKKEKDYDDLTYLSDWLERNTKYIVSDDKFPIDFIQGENGRELLKNTAIYDSGFEDVTEEYEIALEWSENHMWSFSGTNIIYPYLFFRKVGSNIEISWDTEYDYEGYNERNKKYHIEFVYPKGCCYILIDEFKEEVLRFIRQMKEEVNMMNEKLSYCFLGKCYDDLENFYERKAELKFQFEKEILKEVNSMGYDFHSVYNLILIKKDDKKLIPVILKYLKRVGNQEKVHLVRFLGIKGFTDATGFLLNEFYNTEDFDYRFAIANTLSLIQDKNSLNEFVEIIKNEKYGEARIPIIYRIHEFKDSKIKSVLENLLNDAEVGDIAEYSLKQIENKKILN